MNLSVDNTAYLWEMMYRPQTLEECILPTFMKDTFRKVVESGELNNMLLVSPSPGTGKTTVARALANDMGYDTLFINASLENGIDLLRTKLRQYVSTFSFEGKPKLVILDEFDQTSNDFQKAFRGFVEEFKTARFILTCNYLNKVIDPIQSRFTTYEFVSPEEEKTALMKQMIVRMKAICQDQNIPISNMKVLAELARRNFPDNRSCLVALQNYARHGEINEGILGQIVAGDDISEFIQAMKSKDFKTIRSMVPSYANDYSTFIRRLYESLYPCVKNKPDMIWAIAENNQYATSVPDMEIHITGLAVRLMMECQFDG